MTLTQFFGNGGTAIVIQAVIVSSVTPARIPCGANTIPKYLALRHLSDLLLVRSLGDGFAGGTRK